jgi:hypothetical protein
MGRLRLGFTTRRRRTLAVKLGAEIGVSSFFRPG